MRPSLGSHEAQARFWENHVGGTLAFWQVIEPRMRELFPESMRGLGARDFHAATATVRPSLIRVEADEVTYNLHIVLRFELERALIAGDLEVADLPEAWNARMKELLGIVPSAPADGVMQDVHWPSGLFGYFPTYTLGNLYAAQLAAAVDSELGGLEAAIAHGAFDRILRFMRDRVHRHGALYPTAELMTRATGVPLERGHADRTPGASHDDARRNRRSPLGHRRRAPAPFGPTVRMPIPLTDATDTHSTRRPRAAAAATILAGSITAAAPAAHRTVPAAASVDSANAEAQLLAALQTRLSAARALESATLAAVDQRLRAIYAEPTLRPHDRPAGRGHPAGRGARRARGGADALGRSPAGRVHDVIDEPPDRPGGARPKRLRLTAARRIAAARRAAHPAGATAPAATPLPATATAPGGGLPAAVATQHSLPGAVPINPHTGHPYPVAGA